ncbi:MAG: ABC transporter ATP-binding protein [Ignavibacteriaceae bacterium]|nr:ABC transporter ATP-binding protein [Ignavibacteriaceae bacterium]
MNAIETNSLTKIYSSSFGKKKITALNDFTISIPPGTIFGLLGPNGAGKTTLIKLLLGITFPNAGNSKILGKEVSDYKIKSRIGYLPENHKYPPYLSGKQVLEFFGKLSGMQGFELNRRIDEMLDLVKLEKWKKIKVKAYSKGMMQRLGLAQAMINNPDVLFLDEPTDGVDPIGRKEIRDILMNLKEMGKTIFLNSHLLSEVELVTDRVGILNKGKLIREGKVSELTERKQEYRIRVEGKLPQTITENLLAGQSITVLSDGAYSLKLNDLNELNSFIDQLRNNHIIITEVLPLKNTLEEMFISLIYESDKESVQ